jgi:tripartite-type tricarboxylate transporter receptor subunit TctC
MLPAVRPTCLARLVADYLGRDLKQATIVENKPGAQGAIGAEAVARADPDGYTLFVAAGSIIVLNPMLYKKLSYDPVKDFWSAPGDRQGVEGGSPLQ